MNGTASKAPDYPTGTTHIYQGRPAQVTKMTRAYCAGPHARKGSRSAYTIYTVYFLDGADAGASGSEGE